MLGALFIFEIIFIIILKQFNHSPFNLNSQWNILLVLLTCPHTSLISSYCTKLVFMHHVSAIYCSHHQGATILYRQKQQIIVSKW